MCIESNLNTRIVTIVIGREVLVTLNPFLHALQAKVASPQCHLARNSYQIRTAKEVQGGESGP